MNTIVTSKEAILRVCRELVSENGLLALNMRTVAQRCNVALGSLYNYFPSKNDLTLAAIESVWQDIFHMDHSCRIGDTFPDYVQWIFESVQTGMTEYPNFFTAHSISFASNEKDKARQTMEHYFQHMKIGMCHALESDIHIRSDAFDATFTQTDFVDFTLSGLLSLLMQHRSNCSVLLEIIRRTIY